jgi:hypothetical protein
MLTRIAVQFGPYWIPQKEQSLNGLRPYCHELCEYLAVALRPHQNSAAEIRSSDG